MLYVVNAICVVETVISSLYWVHKRCADGFSCRAMPGQPIQAIRTTALIHHSPPPKVQSSRLFPSFGFLHCIRELSLFMCQPLVYVPSLLVSFWFVRMQRHDYCIRCRRKVWGELECSIMRQYIMEIHLQVQESSSFSIWETLAKQFLASCATVLS